MMVAATAAAAAATAAGADSPLGTVQATVKKAVRVQSMIRTAICKQQNH
jgi:hypothetical protein